METIDVILKVLSVLLTPVVTIMIFFIKWMRAEIKELRQADTTQSNNLNIMNSNLSVLTNDHKNKYDSITEKFDELKEVIKDLTTEMKRLNSRIKD